MLIKINFLPYREQILKNQTQKFKQILLGVVLGSAALVFLWGYIYDHKIENQQQRNEFLNQETLKLDQQLIEVKSLRAEIKDLVRQRDTVYQLQNNRAYALEWLEMLARRTPEEIYLTKVEQTGSTYTINGTATNNERISQFMTQLGMVQWVQNTRLAQSQSKIVEETTPLNNEKIDRTLYEFTISFDRVVPVVAETTETSENTETTEAINPEASSTTPSTPSTPTTPSISTSPAP